MSSNVVPFRAASAPARSSESGKASRKYADVRSREYLLPDEIEALMSAARNVGRHRHRDATLILLSYRHGLRVSEAITLRWDLVDLKRGTIHVPRIKNGVDCVHPLSGPEIRALRRLRREYPDSPFLFCTERRGPMTASGVRKMVARAGRRAKLGFPVHPHMLRHACGYTLANKAPGRNVDNGGRLLLGAASHDRVLERGREQDYRCGRYS